jgi:plasmid segregation protein ParM
MNFDIEIFAHIVFNEFDVISHANLTKKQRRCDRMFNQPKTLVRTHHDLIAVDIGRGYSKAKSHKGDVVFESIIDVATDLTVYSPHPEDLILELENGEKLFVGDLARIDGANMKRKPTTESKATEDSLRLFYGLLFRSGFKSGVIDVQTGAPKTNFENGDAKKLKELIENGGQPHVFTMNGERCEVIVRNCWVTVEGGAAFYGIKAMGYLPSRLQVVRVIDPGAFTTNYATYKFNAKRGWVYVNGESGTIPRGWENGNSGIDNIEENAEELASMISSRTQKVWKTDLTEGFFLVGGKASKTEEIFKRHFPDICAVTDAQKMNVYGYYELGKIAQRDLMKTVR